jgi:iron complex outermembrane recepter protein
MNKHRQFLATTALSFLLVGTSPAWAQSGTDANSGDVVVVDESEIIITANRREELLSKVPISVVALSRQTLDLQGARSIDDIARLTPNVQFSRQQFGSGNRSFIAIRGIRSTVGTATTGIYIDDTPIQVRTVRSATNTNIYPQVFDLERIEVLKGPQGTLFGAGSQGGTIRFLTTEADLDSLTGYGRTEISTTEGGALSYEAGFALSMPLVTDELAVRASGWYRRDGGYVDRIDRTTGETLNKNTNEQDSYSARIALKMKLGETITVSPSIFYQKVSTDDSAIFWQSLTDLDAGDIRSGNALRSPVDDEFIIAAIKTEADLGNVTFVANTSYFSRDMNSYPNYTEYVWQLFTGQPYPLLPSLTFGADYLSSQDVFTQEARLQSSDPAARLAWTVGAFYSHSKQMDFEGIHGASLETMVPLLTGRTVEEYFGVPLYQGYAFYDNQKSIDEQIAVFGQADYRFTDTLKATLGLRVSHTQFSFDGVLAGPTNGSAAFFSGKQSETPVTPKFGLTWEPDQRTMVYASAAKGFRVGGAQGGVAAGSCAADLATLGLTSAPTEYGADEVWSYEVGTKSRLLGGKLSVEASAFWIDWSQIQARVTLPSCGVGFMTNVGSATSKGLDLGAALRLGNLSLEAAVGYVDATYDETLQIGNATIVAKGQRLARSPWSGSASVQYDLPLGDVTAYGRVNYQFRSEGSRVPSIVLGYDGTIPGDPATHFVSLRAGVRKDTLNISAFIDNLFNDRPNIISRQFTSVPFYDGTTTRPRTFGLTLTSNF